MANNKIDNREFVVTYLRSETLDDVARNLGINRSQVRSKMIYLRKHGVILPKKKHIGSLTSTQVSELNQLIAKYNFELKKKST